MVVYTAGKKPVSETDLATAADNVSKLMHGMHRNGIDGLNIALGAISALRMFVLWNVGIEGVESELKGLAEVLVNGDD